MGTIFECLKVEGSFDCFYYSNFIVMAGLSHLRNSNKFKILNDTSEEISKRKIANLNSTWKKSLTFHQTSLFNPHPINRSSMKNAFQFSCGEDAFHERLNDQVKVVP